MPRLSESFHYILDTRTSKSHKLIMIENVTQETPVLLRRGSILMNRPEKKNKPEMK